MKHHFADVPRPVAYAAIYCAGIGLGIFAGTGAYVLMVAPIPIAYPHWVGVIYGLAAGGLNAFIVLKAAIEALMKKRSNQ